LFDEKIGFEDGYPVILLFMRGFFCPRGKCPTKWFSADFDEAGLLGKK